MLLAPMTPMVPPVPPLDYVHTSAALSLQTGVFPPSSLHMPPTKRPKLTLQTSQFSTPYGSSASATGKRVDSMSAATPTTLNTFTNTFDLTLRPSPSSATTSPATFHPRSKPASALRRHQPYELNLPLGVRPILKNSSLATDYRRGSLTASASPRTGRRVFFPQPKRVSFQPIDEEIITHTYTARHIDLSPSEAEEPSSRSESDDSPEHDGVTAAGALASAKVESAEEGRESCRSPELEDRGRRGHQHSSSAHRSRRKRRRWEWTSENEESGGQCEDDTPIHPEMKAEEPPTVGEAEQCSATGTLQDVEDHRTEPQEETRAPVVTYPITKAITPQPSQFEIETLPANSNDTALVLEDVHTIAASTPLPPSPVIPQTASLPHVMSLVKGIEEGA